MTRKPSRSGFTLIELLIVVAIIGILAAIAVPNFLNAQVRAKLARVYSDLKALSTAIEMYKLDNNISPPYRSILSNIPFRQKSNNLNPFGMAVTSTMT